MNGAQGRHQIFIYQFDITGFFLVTFFPVYPSVYPEFGVVCRSKSGLTLGISTEPRRFKSCARNTRFLRLIVGHRDKRQPFRTRMGSPSR
jgi:hypothetical protein